jgi:hypothetical protein
MLYASNYHPRSYSTTGAQSGGGRQPSEDHIDDSMDIRDDQNAENIATTVLM